MSSSGKAKVDPGWNDPPMLNYNASNPPPKSRITNKRVAFPLTGTVNSPPQAPLTNLPPSAPPLPVPVDNTKENLAQFFTSDKSRENFHKIYSELPEECKKSVKLMTDCLVMKNNAGAHIHKNELLTLHKSLCENWLKDIKF